MAEYILAPSQYSLVAFTILPLTCLKMPSPLVNANCVLNEALARTRPNLQQALLEFVNALCPEYI